MKYYVLICYLNGWQDKIECESKEEAEQLRDEIKRCKVYNGSKVNWVVSGENRYANLSK